MATAVQYTPSAKVVAQAEAALSAAVKQSGVLEGLARKYLASKPKGLLVKRVKRSFNKPLLAGFETDSKEYHNRSKMLSLVWKRILGGTEKPRITAFKRAVAALAALPVSRFAAVVAAAKAAKSAE